MNDFTRYETPKDRINEREIGDEVGRVTGVDVVSTSKGCPWDFECYEGGKMVAILEAKDRSTVRFGQYEDIIIDTKKWSNCVIKAAESGSIPFWYAVRYEDGIGMTDSHIPLPVRSSMQCHKKRGSNVPVLGIASKNFQRLSWFEFNRQLW